MTVHEISPDFVIDKNEIFYGRTILAAALPVMAASFLLPER